MDKVLVKAIVDLKVPYFGENLKNKGDSQSCMFDVRKLSSSPKLLKYVGEKMADIVKKETKANCIVGVATSGISWGTVSSLYSGLPFLYVRKTLERHMSNKLVEGIIPENPRAVLIDDLLFAGQSKNEAIEILKEQKIKVTDILVIVDRQLEREKDGLSISEKNNATLHSLVTMEEIIDYMMETNAITAKQLMLLIRDYQQFKRWRTPSFAKTAATQ